jgi:hypothetical protein
VPSTSVPQGTRGRVSFNRDNLNYSLAYQRPPVYNGEAMT